MKADWTNGIWHFDTAEGIQTGAARVTVCSDWLPLRNFKDVIAADPVAVYGDALPFIRQSDLNVVNVETTLGTAGKPIPKAGPNFQAEAESVRSLTEAPFHVACMANNHIMDYGPDSLASTLKALQSAGLKTVGAGMTGTEASEPLRIEVNGLQIAIVNCAEGEACRSIDNGPGAYGFDRETVIPQVRELAQKTDFVLVIFHGGREYAPLPPEYVVSDLRAVAEAGANAVIAHHPHVPQGIEVHKGVPIAYSQGNFAFWQEDGRFYTHAGYMVHLDIGRKQICKMEITPYMIEPQGLSVMKGALKEGFLNMLKLVSELLADPAHVRSAWHAFIDSVGLEGMKRMVLGPTSKLDAELEVGAAQLQNLFFTPAHRELFIRGLARVSRGELGDSPDWAKELVRLWTKALIGDEKARLTSNRSNAVFLPT